MQSDMNSGFLGFDALFPSSGLSGKTVTVEAEQLFFTQGDAADAIFYLQRGRAKLCVVSKSGKQATIMLISPGDIFGEESLGAMPGERMSTVIALNTCSAVRIQREEMIRFMHEDHDFCDNFLSYLLARSLRRQADLADQIFNTSEKRLARTLLLLAEASKADKPRTAIPPITQETLAEMIGTTRSRVSYFMNRFRSRGIVDYKDRITVHKPRLRAVLLDQQLDFNAELRAVASAS
jgi:CRP/FNR family transcriptional regulator, cyclic AMP receptor protein